MTATVTVIDYGMGNLFSVSRAFEHCGAEVVVADAPERIAAAERLVLPGVGAFADGMAELASRHLVEPILDFCRRGRPFLGICLGMQMMMEYSEEFGVHKGLGLIAGGVLPIPTKGTDGRPHKIPHIGWNALFMPRGRSDWGRTPLQHVAPESSVYFVHSFAAAPKDPAHLLAQCSYDGVPITGAIGNGMMFGCQFHPEKSARTGLQVIRDFLAL